VLLLQSAVQQVEASPQAAAVISYCTYDTCPSFQAAKHAAAAWLQLRKSSVTTSGDSTTVSCCQIRLFKEVQWKAVLMVSVTVTSPCAWK
jgi:hypothetical protein